MGLFKLLKAANGKGSTTNTTDLHQQIKEGRVYDPSGLNLANSPSHQYLMSETGGTFADTGVDANADFTNSGVTYGAGLVDGSGIYGSGQSVAASISSENLSGVNGFSIAMWIYPNSAQDNQLFWHEKGGTTNNLGLFCHLISGSFGVQWEKAGGGAEGLVGTTAFNNSAWNLVVATFDGTTDADGIKLYLNGSLITQGTAAAASLASTSGIPIIGSYNQSGGNRFNGEIESCHIWRNVAIPASDVTKLYGGGPSSPPATLDYAASLVTDGDVVYLDSSGQVAPADATDEAKSEVIGFYEDTDNSVIAKRGSVVTGFTKVAADTLAAGDIVYLAKEAGKITNDISAYAAGDSVVRVGYMEDASTLILDPKFMYIN